MTIGAIVMNRNRAASGNLSQNLGERSEGLICQMRARSERRDSTFTYSEGRARTRKPAASVEANVSEASVKRSGRNYKAIGARSPFCDRF
jgi:hypothetical protein